MYTCICLNLECIETFTSACSFELHLMLHEGSNPQPTTLVFNRLAFWGSIIHVTA